jgi:hypothetical protein
MDEPKKDTVRIALPPRRVVTSAPETGGISPRRSPFSPPAATSPILQPLPKPPGVEPASEPTLPAHPLPLAREEREKATALNHGPKKETARVGLLAPAAPSDSIPRPLAWAVFGIAVVIFLIQIWNYVVS